jgi:hypothetical protein
MTHEVMLLLNWWMLHFPNSQFSHEACGLSPQFTKKNMHFFNLPAESNIVCLLQGPWDVAPLKT